jgi:uncharacterized protein YjbI with pentapeptide repeats
MADKTQLAQLKQGAKAWNAWRAAHATARPDLSGAGLFGLDLAGAQLAAADLRRADLRGADLRGAVLAGADLEGADFFKAVLDEADLAGANLAGARFLSCLQLATARHLQTAFRDAELACGASIPSASAAPR